MQAAQLARLEKLEILYSEQDNVVQSLNETVAQQEREILRLTRGIERLTAQLQSIMNGLGDDIDPGFEKPPHY